MSKSQALKSKALESEPSESGDPAHIEGLKLSNLLCFAVYSANHAFNRLYKPILDELGLTYPQYVAMVTLWREDGLTVGQIGERILLETNTVTPLLKRMEAAGLVLRTRCKADERQVLVHLTEKGKALREKARSLPNEVGICFEHDRARIEKLTDDITNLRDALLAKAKG
jgi:DNA-binding MarR family transcriptional regulator